MKKVEVKLSAAQHEVSKFKGKVDDVLEDINSINAGLEQNELKLQKLAEMKEQAEKEPYQLPEVEHHEIDLKEEPDSDLV